MRTAAAVIFVALLVSVPIPLLAKFMDGRGSERKELSKAWDAGNFKEVFEISQNALSAKPMNYFLLVMNGFSAYQLGIAQINSFDIGLYMDECITSLRHALLLKESASDGRVYYVLGKAYSYKGSAYADLVIKYLETARDLSHDAADIPEYLGLAYAAVGDYHSSVEAFSRALGSAFSSPSDSLLLAIARSYVALEEFDTARAYLLRCVEISADSNSISTARFLLAEVFRKTGDYDGAEDQYGVILTEAGESAEAHYQLGEIYSLRGDTTRARSEWRLAYRIDPAHAKARARLNI